MNFWNSMNGMLQLRLTSADLGTAIQQITDSGITIADALRDDEDITLTFFVRRRDLPTLQEFADRKGLDLQIVSRKGIYWNVKRLLHRPVLVVGLALICFLAMYLPSRIFFVRVEGNLTVPTRLILEKCSQCGIGFGASRAEVRSQKMKDALLEAIPQLQWAGVNTSGCVATVTVRERSDEPNRESTTGVSSIVALRDGIITEITVTSGNGICRVGQVVREGDLLVSGFTDCGLHIQAVRAEAEVFAQTQRELTAVLPTAWTQKAEIRSKKKKYALIIGKNRINFYKGSGISGTTCDKMYSESYVTLPGGFVLPIALVTEEWTYTQSADLELTEDEAQKILTVFSEAYLSSQMVAGSILNDWTVTLPQDGLFRLEGNYACTEMIAQVRDEENIPPNGNDYRTDR